MIVRRGWLHLTAWVSQTYSAAHGFRCLLSRGKKADVIRVRIQVEEWKVQGRGGRLM